MGKNVQAHPLPSSIKTVHFLCFLWHGGPAFQMQLWNDFKWPFWVPQPTTTQREREAAGRFSPRVTRCCTTGRNVIFFQKASVLHICMPKASTAAREQGGANAPEASLIHRVFSSHQPRWPGPSTGACGRPRSENWCQFNREREGKEKTWIIRCWLLVLSSKSGGVHTQGFGSAYDGVRSQRSDQVISAQDVQHLCFPWQLLLAEIPSLRAKPCSSRRGCPHACC